MIERYGGRVTGSVSGKTDHLVVGKNPGTSKVCQARNKNISVLDLLGLKNSIQGVTTLQDAPPPVITNFSSGYRGNAVTASAQQLAYARHGGPALKDGDNISRDGDQKKVAKKSKAPQKAPPTVHNGENLDNRNKKPVASGKKEAPKMKTKAARGEDAADTTAPITTKKEPPKEMAKRKACTSVVNTAKSNAGDDAETTTTKAPPMKKRVATKKQQSAGAATAKSTGGNSSDPPKKK
jgi:hypothetical protein